MASAAVGIVGYMCGSNEELDAYVKLLVIRARQLVQAEHQRPALDALAAALLDRRRVTGREAKTIMANAL